MSRFQHIARLGVLMAWTALAHIWLIRTSVSPALDAIYFVRIAQRFAGERFIDVVRSEPGHPLYPMLIAWAEPVVRQVTGAPSHQIWLVTGQLVAALSAVLLVLPVYGLALEVLGPRCAWWGTLAFVLLPSPSRVTADGLSDGLHLLWFTVALWAALVAWNHRQPAWLALTGIASGLGYWTRPEAMFVPLAVLVWLSAIQGFARERWAWRQTLIAIACLLVGTATLVAPYMVLKGAWLSDKNAVHLLLRLPTIASGAQLVPERNQTAGATCEGSGVPADAIASVSTSVAAPTRSTGETGNSKPPAATAARSYQTACHKLMLDFLAASHYVFPAFALGAIVAPWGMRSHKPAAYLLVGIAVLLVGLLVRLYVVAGYVSTRHTLGLIVIMCPWLGSGLVMFSDRIVRVVILVARRFVTQIDETRISLGVRAVLISLLSLACLPKLLEPLHPSRWGHCQAAAWLTERASHDAAVLDNHGIVTFYTGLKQYTFRGLHRAITDSRLQYVVVESHDLARTNPPYARVRQLVDGLGPPLANFPFFEGGKEPGVLVFGVPASVVGTDSPGVDPKGLGIRAN